MVFDSVGKPNRSWSVVCAGTICLTAYSFLSVQSQGYGQAGLSDLLIVSAVALGATLWVWRGAQTGRIALNLPVVIGFAVLFRLVGVTAFPVLEDDFYRYLLDGRNTVVEGSPYGVPPSSYFDDESVTEDFEAILDGINYPEVSTIYGPLSQWTFALGYLISPGAVWPLQLLAAIFDITLIFLLAALVRSRRSTALTQPTGNALGSGALLLYAWSPLIVKEFAMTAHTDVLGALAVVAALLAYQKQAWIWVGMLLACACGSKVFALVVVPFLLGWQPKAILSFGLTAVALGAPFGLIEAWLPGGLEAMSSDWLFNSPLYFLAGHTLGGGSITPLKVILLCGFAAVWFWAYGRWLQRWKQHGPPAIETLPHWWLYGLFMLALPALNPWYLIWWLPFAVLRPTRTAWAASGALLLAYGSGINLAGNSEALYDLPIWLMVLEFGIVAVALAFDLRHRFASRP